MNAKFLVFPICVEAIIYLLLQNLHASIFKFQCRSCEFSVGMCVLGGGRVQEINTSRSEFP